MPPNVLVLLVSKLVVEKQTNKMDSRNEVFIAVFLRGLCVCDALLELLSDACL